MSDAILYVYKQVIISFLIFITNEELILGLSAKLSRISFNSSVSFPGFILRQDSFALLCFGWLADYI